MWIENSYGQYSLLYDTIKTNDGKWHFVALVVDSDSITLHVDDRIASKMLVKGRIDFNYNKLIIGNNENNLNQTFNGEIDELRVYLRAIDKETLDLLRKIESSQNTSVDIYKKDNILTYPNPSGSQFIIQLPSEKPSSIFVYNIQGKLLRTIENSSKSLLINNMEPGIYIIKIVQGDQIFITKQIVK